MPLLLGTGTFSRVRICRHKASGKYMALKILKKSEIIRLKQVQHVQSERSCRLRGLCGQGVGWACRIA